MTTKLLCSLVVLALLASSSPAFAQQPQTRMRSGKLAFAGLITTVAGLGLATPIGESVRVLDNDYCVTERAVDYGRCKAGETKRMIGFIAAGMGGVLMGVGLSRVKVYPTVKGAGVAYQVQW